VLEGLTSLEEVLQAAQDTDDSEVAQEISAIRENSEPPALAG
jgi:hypothetical protein